MKGIDQILSMIGLLAAETNVSVYVVGGAVRDLLLGKLLQDDDLDLAIEGDALGLAERFARETGGTLQRFESFLSSKVRLGLDGEPLEVDFVATRKEVYPAPAALPTVAHGTIEEDLWRRDFSINAMALPLEAFQLRSETTGRDILDTVLDPTSGRRDLDMRLVRILHSRSFVDDPTRVFRAARYVARINGRLDDDSLRALQRALAEGRVASLSNVRRMNELYRVTEERDPRPAFLLLQQWGVIDASGLIRASSKGDFGRFALKLAEVAPHPALRKQLMQCIVGLCTVEDSPEKFFLGLGIPRSQRESLLAALSGRGGGELIEPLKRLMSS